MGFFRFFNGFEILTILFLIFVLLEHRNHRILLMSLPKKNFKISKKKLKVSKSYDEICPVCRSQRQIFVDLILRGEPHHRKILEKFKNFKCLKLYELHFAPGFSSEGLIFFTSSYLISFIIEKTLKTLRKNQKCNSFKIVRNWLCTGF